MRGVSAHLDDQRKVHHRRRAPGRWELKSLGGAGGRDWSKGPEKSCTVAIPPSRRVEHIAVALAELAGVANVPYVIDVLLSAAE